MSADNDTGVDGTRHEAWNMETEYGAHHGACRVRQSPVRYTIHQRRRTAPPPFTSTYPPCLWLRVRCLRLPLAHVLALCGRLLSESESPHTHPDPNTNTRPGPG